MKIELGDMFLIKYKHFVDIVEVLDTANAYATVKIIHTSEKYIKENTLLHSIGYTYPRSIAELKKELKVDKKNIESVKLLYF